MRFDRPGQFADDLEPRADDAVFRRSAGDGFEPIQFAIRLLHHGFGKFGGFEFLAQDVDFATRFAAAFAELLADRLHLLLQIVASLRFVDVLLDLRLDLILQFQNIQLRRRAAPRSCAGVSSTSSSSRMRCFSATSACRFAARKSASAEGLVIDASTCCGFIRRIRRKLDHLVRLLPARWPPAHRGSAPAVSTSSSTSISPTANGSVRSISSTRNRAMPCTMID